MMIPFGPGTLPILEKGSEEGKASVGMKILHST